MNQQKYYLSNNYNITGIKFKKPKNKWTVTAQNKTSIEGISLEDYISNIADYTVDSTHQYPNGVISLSSWDKTTTPPDETLQNTDSRGYIKPSDVIAGLSNNANYLSPGGSAFPEGVTTTTLGKCYLCWCRLYRFCSKKCFLYRK
ncbi:MAG: hypothetical protein JXR64_13570 [Spirochaetales bacterium]|nr:hypothetical protein [Spirochaetales bacterium]